MSYQPPILGQRKRLSAPLVLSIIFLIASIAASIFIIRQVTQPSQNPIVGVPSPQQTGTTLPSTNTPILESTMAPPPSSIVAVDPVITTTSTGTPIPAETLVIGLSPLSSDVANLTGSFQVALESALLESLLPQPFVFVQVHVPADALTGVLELSAEYEVDILLAWEIDTRGLLRIYMSSPSHPSLGIVGAPIKPWQLVTPGNLSLYSVSDGDLSFPAGLAVAVLEQEAGLIDSSLVRLQALQALPVGLPADGVNHNQAALSYMVAQAEALQGNVTRALQSYSQALRHYEDFAAAHFNRANLYLTLGDWEAARAGYQRAADLAPESAAPIYNGALTSWAAGDLDGALATALNLSDQYPHAVWTYNLVGLIYYDQGLYEEALASFQQASSLDTAAQAPLFNEALTLHTMGRYDEAVGVYTSLLDLAPDNAVYLTHLALTYQAQGDYRAAERIFSEAIDLDPTYVDALFLRGQLYLETNEYDRAIADATSLLELNLDDGRAYEIVGDAMLAQEDFAAAVEAYTEGIDLGLNHPQIYAKRGWGWHRQHYIQAAIRDYRQAIEAGSTDPLVLYWMGFALLDAGWYEDALEALLGAINQGIDTPEASAILAVALDANFRRDEAEQAYQRALDRDSRYGDPEFLAEQILWSPLSIRRAETILRRLEEN